jgi:hypothetical protein
MASFRKNRVNPTGDTQPCVYRHFNAAGDLLYVGVSNGFTRRQRVHARSAHWFPEISRIEIERFPTYEAACEAESRAIRSESPLYNNGKNAPVELPPPWNPIEDCTQWQCAVHPAIPGNNRRWPLAALNSGTPMPETRNAFVTVCFPPEEVPLLDFAAKEFGQTRSSFIYVLVRNQLRAMKLLQQPAIPKPLPNGKDARAQGPA